MSLFNERYADPSPGQAPSAGPREGFAGAFELAYDAQVRGWAQFGLERSFSEADAEQRALIRDRTGGEPAGLSEGLRNMPSYLKMARYFENGGSPEDAEQVNKWDAEITKLQGQHPELKTYRQLWEDVKGRANASEDRWDNSTTSWGGMLGGFLGGAVASVDPRSDPLNALSLGIAPGAQTVARRVAVAAGGNAAVEAVNQFTGVQENRRLLGLENSTGQAVKHILFAGAVGGGFQGGGELISAGVRRLTATRVAQLPLGTPGPPPGPLVPADVSGRVPAWDAANRPVSQVGDVGRDVSQLRPSDLFGDADSFVKEVRAPWAESRLGQRRMQQELDQTVAHMQRFDAEGPFEHQPRSRTAVQEPVTRANVEAPWWIRDQDQVADELARHYDPELYRQLDTIDAQTQELRSRADTLRSIQTTDRAKHVDAEIDRVQDLEKQIEQLRSKAGDKRYKQRDAEFKIRVLNNQQRRILAAIKDDALRLTDAQTEAFQVAQKLLDLGHARDTLVPLQKHAEAVARGEMVLHMSSTEALVMFDRLAAYGVDITPRMSQRVSESGTQVKHDGTRGVPSERVAETLQPGETQGQAVVRTTKEAAADLDDGDVLVQRVRQALADENPEATIDLGGGLIRLDQEIMLGATKDADGIVVPQSKTVRQLLKEIGDDDDMLKAMQVCSKP